MMTKKLFKESGDRWAEASITLEDGRLSISGSEGEIVRASIARKMALEYWESFLEEMPEEMDRMREEFGRRTRKGAARYIIDTDGAYHGLDVHKEENGKVYLTESSGQIRETLRAWFPELIPALPYHLNDMHAECVHQEQRGETYKTHPLAECPDCGYKLGSAWTKRELPQDIVSLVERL